MSFTRYKNNKNIKNNKNGISGTRSSFIWKLFNAKKSRHHNTEWVLLWWREKSAGHGAPNRTGCIPIYTYEYVCMYIEKCGHKMSVFSATVSCKFCAFTFCGGVVWSWGAYCLQSSSLPFHFAAFRPIHWSALVIICCFLFASLCLHSGCGVWNTLEWVKSFC